MGPEVSTRASRAVLIHQYFRQVVRCFIEARVRFPVRTETRGNRQLPGEVGEGAGTPIPKKQFEGRQTAATGAGLEFEETNRYADLLQDC